MIYFKELSIRTKLKFVILSTTFLSITVVFVALFVYEYLNYNHILLGDLAAKSELLAENMDAAIAFHDSLDASQVLQSLATQQQIIGAAVYYPTGEMFASYAREGRYVMFPPKPWLGEPRMENDIMTFSHAVYLRGEPLCTVNLVVDVAERSKMFASYTKIAAGVLFGSLFIAFFISTALQRSVSGPLLSLAGTAERFSRLGDYSLRASKVTNDEIGVLVDSINSMLAQLEERDRVLRQTNQAMGTEIRERRKAEERFRSVVESAPNAMVMSDVRGRIVLVNAQTETLFGYRREELIGEPVERLIPERYRGRRPAYLMAPAEGRASGSMGTGRDLTGLRKDGSEFPFEIGNNPIDTEGEAMVLSAIIDTTDHKLAERALQRAHDELERRVAERTAELLHTNEELRLMQTISHAMGGVKSLDEALQVVLENICESAGFMLGQAWVYNKEEGRLHCSEAWYSKVEGMEGFRALNLDLSLPVTKGLPSQTAVMQRSHWIKEFDLDPAVSAREEMVREAGLSAGMAVPLMVDNTLFAVIEFFSYKPMEENSRIVSLVSAIAAQLGIVLERKRAEELLRTSEMELEEAHQMATLGSVKWEIATNKFTCSDEFYGIFGLQPDDPFTYETYLNLVHPDDRAAVRQHADRALHANEPFAFEHRIIRPDGVERVINTRGKVVFDEKGRPVRMIGTGQDITEWKRTKAILRESEERFRILVEGVRDYAIYMLDLNGNIISWNAGAERINGYTAEEVIGRHYAMLHPAEEGRTEKIQDMLRLAETGGSVELEGWRAHKSGHLFWAHSIVTALRNEEGGEVIGFTSVTRDITERKRAEEELRKRDILLSTAQQVARLGSWEWDIQASRVTWSDELAHIYGIGLSTSGWTLEYFLEYVYNDRPETLTLIQEALRTLTPFEFEERFIHPDGTLRILHNDVKVLVDGNGKPFKVVGICVDVTDRRRADEKFRNLLESAPDAMVIVDPLGTITLVNAQTERLFGYTRAEIVGQHVGLLLPPRLRHLHALFVRSVPQGTDDHVELFGLRKNGTEVPIEVNLSPLETEDGTLISNAIRDITEQQNLRARLIDIERKRSFDLRRYAISVQRAQEEERRRVARELHDDLCQRLSGMKMNLEVIGDEIRGKDKALYHKLRSFNKKCEEMIVEVRRMSVNLRPSVLDDFGLVSALGILTRDFEKLHGLPVALEVDHRTSRLQLPPHVEIALYRIVQEALTNVAKHAQASRITLAVHKNRDDVEVRIADNGTGFNPATTGVRKEEHTGLGLISMRERTELAGGAFSVVSSPGSGTTVTVSIPITKGVLYEEDAVADRG